MSIQPTKEQWEDVAKRLDSMYDGVYLLADGYYVSAALTRIDNTLRIAVAVNGWQFKGEWLPRLGKSADARQMSEEARRFWRPQIKRLHSGKELEYLEKALGKKFCKEHGYYDTYVWPNPTWLRPAPFIRHLQRNNTDIEIIDYSRYESGITTVFEPKDVA